jgi:Glycosyl transferases group 1
MSLIRRIVPEKWRRELSTKLLLAQERFKPRRGHPHSYRETAYLRIYFQTERYRLLFSRGFPSHQTVCADLFRESDTLLVYVPCFAGHRRLALEALRTKQMGLKLEQVILLANTLEDRAIARDLGFQAEFINHNCWIDENIFRPQVMEKKYRATLISSPLPVKRWQLAAEVQSLALLSHSPFPVDKSPLKPVLYREGVAPSEVARVLNQSQVSLCLSAAEGACLAASESILCGIPVVSTSSAGGRDVWYSPNNHLICEDNCQAVAAAVRAAIEADFDPILMREEHLRRAQSFRDEFVKLTERLGCERGIEADWHAIFQDKYVHNMVSARPVETIREELKS